MNNDEARLTAIKTPVRYEPDGCEIYDADNKRVASIVAVLGEPMDVADAKGQQIADALNARPSAQPDGDRVERAKAAYDATWPRSGPCNEYDDRVPDLIATFAEQELAAFAESETQTPAHSANALKDSGRTVKRFNLICECKSSDCRDCDCKNYRKAAEVKI